MSENLFAGYLRRVAHRETLSADDAARAFGEMLNGSASEMQMAGFLSALTVRGPTIDEMVGAARAMRSNMRKVDCVPGALDLCGTGGDGHGTLNISTAVSFVVVGAGVPVAKHGNRNMSSKSGAADVLEALGVKIDIPAEQAALCLREVGLCFLFAQAYHPGMKHVSPVRKALAFRTIFNLAGPLSNPAGVRRQLVGLYAPELIENYAHALDALGAEKAFVVHGSDGMDEITITGPTHVAVLNKGQVSRNEIKPEDAGLSPAPLSAIRGGEAKENAVALRALLDGKKDAYRDIVLLNAAAALIVADKAKDLKEGVAIAAESLDKGHASAVLAKLVTASNA
jgi:anthranilate phosphoribosyltransferase